MTKTRARILVLTSTFPRWKNDQIPSFVLTLSSMLTRCYSVRVLAPWDHGARKSEIMNGVEVKRFQYFLAGINLTYGGGIADNVKNAPLKLLLIPFYIAAQTYAIFKELKAGHYDLIHAHWLIPQGFSAIIACYLAGVNPKEIVVCTCHGSDINGYRGKFGTLIKKWISQRVRCLTVVSESLKQELEKVCNSTPNKVIPMGSDFDSIFFRDSRIERKPKTSIFVGRLIEQKGLWVLLSVFKVVVTELPEAKLILVGEGPLKKEIQDYLMLHSLEKNVELAGFRNHSELPNFYNHARICIVPSLENEGFGLTIVESMGCECITLASDFPSTRELIAPGENGFLFSSGDEDRLFSLWMDLLKSNIPDVDLERVGRDARKSVINKYDWVATKNMFVQLFDESIIQEDLSE